MLPLISMEKQTNLLEFVNSTGKINLSQVFVFLLPIVVEGYTNRNCKKLRTSFKCFWHVQSLS